MNYSELRRFLAKQGCTFETHKGGSGHITVIRGTRTTQIPAHGKGKELGKGAGAQDFEGPRPQVISYRVKLTPDSNGTFLVTSPDFPELTTFGETKDDALRYALGALEEAIEARISRRREIPPPPTKKTAGHWVTLPTQAAVKVMLYQEMNQSGLRKADLARKMDLHRQEIDRLLDLNHATSLAKIEKAFAVMGKSLDVAVADAN